VRAAHIRSFVRRQGRVSNAQQRYHEDMMAKIGVPYAAARVDLDALFGRPAPRILEIGFGMGETSAAIAAAHPENDYLGIEVHTPGVGSLCKLVAEHGFAQSAHRPARRGRSAARHARTGFACRRAHLLSRSLAEENATTSVACCSRPFLSLLASRLQPGGYDPLRDRLGRLRRADAGRAVGRAAAAEHRGGYAPRPDYRPQTKFEQRGLRLGHGVWDLVFRRRPASLQPEDHRQDQLA
jgi:tRNA (guanine-N7-)-methyltransferase